MVSGLSGGQLLLWFISLLSVDSLINVCPLPVSTSAFTSLPLIIALLMGEILPVTSYLSLRVEILSEVV